jgi:hypothetical protein
MTEREYLDGEADVNDFDIEDDLLEEEDDDPWYDDDEECHCPMCDRDYD